MKLYLNVSEVAARYGVNTSTIWRWRNDEEKGFPTPHRFGPQTLRWKLAELEAYDAKSKVPA